jgi:hypothetical protein
MKAVPIEIYIALFKGIPAKDIIKYGKRNRMTVYHINEKMPEKIRKWQHLKLQIKAGKLEERLK